MSGPALVVVYAALVVLASLAGGFIPLVARLTHTRTQLLMSFVAGLMLGVGLFHMLPHATAETRSLDQAVWWTVVGLLAMFFLQRFFHFHQHPAIHDAAADVPLPHDLDHDHSQSPSPGGSPHAGGCDHHASHGNPHLHVHRGSGAPKLSWAGVAIGLTLHTLLDGIALAAGVEAEAAEGGAPLAGIGIFLAVVLHKPLDAMAITALMVADGRPAAWRHAVNVAFALIVPLGAALFYLGVLQMAASQHVVVGCALAFSAGAFLYISLSDLLPEVQFHSHDRFKLSLGLLLGIALAYAIGIFETAGHDHHAHPHGVSTPDQERRHEHAH